MTNENNLIEMPVNWKSLGFRMMIGGGIGLTLMILLISGVNNPPAEWGAFWRIRPLVVITFAGACGGVFSYLMEPLRRKGGWRAVLAIFLSVIVYIFGLWMGTVLGLVGTMWN
jgi:hypothetical protein